MNSPGGYLLLKTYMNEAQILSLAYSKSESYYRTLYRIMNYPIIITSAIGTIAAGLKLNEYVLMSISFSTVVISGFNGIINPKEREQKANQISLEFDEIYSNINQFILENDKSKEEIKAYSQLIHTSINNWKSISPNIREKFMKEATAECMEKIRKHSPNLKLKRISI
jgi:hypothetical protein